MSNSSGAARGEAFIKAFADSIVPSIGTSIGEKLEVVDEGLDFLDELNEVHYFIKVRAAKKSSVVITLWSRECIYAPDLDHDPEELLIDRLEDYTDLSRDDIELKLQEAGLR